MIQQDHRRQQRKSAGAALAQQVGPRSRTPGRALTIHLSRNGTLARRRHASNGSCATSDNGFPPSGALAVLRDRILVTMDDDPRSPPSFPATRLWPVGAGRAQGAPFEKLVADL